MTSIGIIGNGFVGSASCELQNPNVEVFIHDIDPMKCVPIGMTLEDIVKKAHLLLVSVPTPMNQDGSCCTHIVESVIADIQQIQRDAKIIIRSTVPIGFCRRWGVSFLPEFLTEKNFIHDFRSNPEWIIGIDNNNTGIQEELQHILSEAKQHGKILSDTIVLKTTEEAEAIKYFRNCFLAVKVSFCNEIYDLCRSLGISYSNVIDTAAADTRIGHSHTRVPGHDGKRGFGGTCFPKDVSSLIYQYHMRNIECPLMESAQRRNNTKDRTEQDWMEDKGRAVVDNINKCR